MEVNRDFEELYERAECKDVVGFNRELYWILMRIKSNTDKVMTDIYNQFLESEHCIECNNAQPTIMDMVSLDDGFVKIYTKVCQDCGVELEFE